MENEEIGNTVWSRITVGVISRVTVVLRKGQTRLV
jgi:hypothetical protein